LQNSRVKNFTEVADEIYIHETISHKITCCFLLQGKKATIFNGVWAEANAVLCGGLDDLHCLLFESQKGF
jgi:hypothetical protein